VGFRIVFEDKSVTAGLIASTEKGDKQRRDQLTAQTVITPEEIEKVRKQMAEKPEVSGMSVKNAGVLTIRPGVEANEFTNSLEMKFRLLPAGGVYFGKNEVREQDVAAWAAATGKVRDKRLTFEQTPEHPAVNITWSEAKDFCNWLTEREHYKKSIKPEASYRLPTDAEWSQAVGLSPESGDNPAAKHLSNKQLYPWGSQWPPPKNIANLDATHLTGYEDAFSYTAPVGSFPPNGLQIYDLAGNVAEWCEDAWPDIPGEHVVRGSSWLSATQEDLLASARRHMKESAFRPNLGFRIVLINRP
jgi:formylglycine-generating enzyme required for sulfatase activity